MSSEKEIAVIPAKYEKCSVVLLDVAGTTTSLQFVKETLFPYANQHIEEYLKENWSSESVVNAIKLLEAESELDVDGAVASFKKLTKENSNNEGLKVIQSLVYKKGYENGTLKAHIYADVKEALENWSKERKIAIYSTGSVDSQKLLFAHTSEGDLTTHISEYYDQGIGKKTESDSYKAISKQLDVQPEDVLFISDEVQEINAAQEAGVQVALIKREVDSEQHNGDFLTVSSFAEVSLGGSNKRKSDEIDSEIPPAKIAKTHLSEEVTINEVKADVEADSKSEVVLNSEVEAMEVDVRSDVDQIIDSKTENTEQTDKEVNDGKIDDSNKMEESNSVENNLQATETKIVEKTEDVEMAEEKLEKTEKKSEQVEEKPVKLTDSNETSLPQVEQSDNDSTSGNNDVTTDVSKVDKPDDVKGSSDVETIKTDIKTDEAELIPQNETKIDEVAHEALENEIEMAQEATEISVQVEKQLQNSISQNDNKDASTVHELVKNDVDSTFKEVEKPTEVSIEEKVECAESTACSTTECETSNTASIENNLENSETPGDIVKETNTETSEVDVKPVESSVEEIDVHAESVENKSILPEVTKEACEVDTKPAEIDIKESEQKTENVSENTEIDQVLLNEKNIDSKENSAEDPLNQNGLIENGTQSSEKPNGSIESDAKSEEVVSEVIENGVSKATASSDSTVFEIKEKVENGEANSEIVIKTIENVESPSVSVEA